MNKPRQSRKFTKLRPRVRRTARPFGFIGRTLRDIAHSELRYILNGLAIGAASAIIFFVNDLRKAAFPASDFVGDVTHVVDGDTFYIRGRSESIRLWGVDAPEIGTPGGAQATHELERLTRFTMLGCDHVTTDRYKRTVARCTLPDGRDLSEEMINSRTVSEYFRYTGSYYALKRIVAKMRETGE